MARYVPINARNARDTVTGDWLDVIERSVWYVHRSKNIIGVMYNGSELLATPTVHLSDVLDTDDEHSTPRKLVLKFATLETGHTYPIIVAVQGSLSSSEYVDCIVEDTL